MGMCVGLQIRHDNQSPKLEQVACKDNLQMEAEIPKNEQKKIIKDCLENDQMKVGDTWYILSFKWWKLWKEYVQYDDDESEQSESESSSKLTQIDNSDLVQLAASAGQKSEKSSQEENDNNSTDRSSKSSTSQDFLPLRNSLQEEEDYSIVSQNIWNYFIKWYGGGPAIPRKVIEEGMSRKFRVEVYPLQLKVVKSKEDGSIDEGSEIILHVSKQASLKQFKDLACKYFSVPSEKIRVWNLFTTEKQLNDENETLEEAMIADDQRMLIEVQLENGNWPRNKEKSESESDTTKHANGKDSKTEANGKEDKKKKKSGFFSFLGFGSNSGTNSNGHSRNPSSEYLSGSHNKGLCGLHNLGNTCFMNSALQCLSNTPPLTEFFMSDRFKSEINKNNPLGMKGRVAEEYGALIKVAFSHNQLTLKQMWATNNSVVAPRDLKLTISKYAPQFSGYSQHDSQELLAFLLDGLHEDLNRVPKKPYIETKDFDQYPSEEAAATDYWSNHLKRNQSVIVDLFQGQLKSTLVCPKCQHVSKCWDPFMYLSLPLPIERDRVIEVIVVKYLENWELPVKYSITVDKFGKIEDITKGLSKFGLDPDQLLLADIYNNRVYAFLSESKPTSGIRTTDITFAYELPKLESNDSVSAESLLRVQIVHRREKKKASGFMYSSPLELFGIPFILFIEKGTTTGKQLHKILWNRTKLFINKEEPPSDNPKEAKEREKDKERFDLDLTKTELAQYPFKLCVTTANGTSCGICNGLSCNGCPVECSDAPLKLKENGHTIAIHWHSKILKRMNNKYELIQQHSSIEETRNARNQPISLMDCLKLFLTDEKLGANDPWFCPKCKEFQQAMKKFDLWKVPQILVVHLKRFQYSKWSRDKIGVMVDFPVSGLDITPFVQGSQAPAIYDLFAVSNHSGGLGGGHYTAYAKNKFDGQWYSFNDSSCTKATEANVQSPAAYVLFYQRRDNPSSPSNEQ